MKKQKERPSFKPLEIVKSSNIESEYYVPKVHNDDLEILGEIPVIKHEDRELNPNRVPYYYFTNKSIVSLTNDPIREYFSRREEAKKTFGWGQRKLGLALIQFLTKHLDKTHLNPQIIYAGAATGENIRYAATLFKINGINPVFHLYDPRQFNIKGDDVLIYDGDDSSITDKITFVLYTGDTHGWFSDQTAMKWRDIQQKTGQVYFLSDIRSVDDKKTTSLQFEEGVWKDMKDQARWVTIINPVSAQLKFRLPYDLPDFTRQFPQGKIPYLAGIIYKGIYSKPTSTESRLVPVRNNEGKYFNKLYDFKDYESKMFYFNTTIKEKYKFINLLHPNDDHKFDPVFYPELLNDFNSMGETFVWIDYLKRMNLQINDDQVKKLTLDMNKALSVTYNKTLEQLRAMKIK